MPENADYELRRELVRADRRRGLHRLDDLVDVLTYLPLNTQTMHLAARYWAEMRNLGIPTADPAALDCDVILAAQTSLLQDDLSNVIVATTNVRHLIRLVDAAEWSDIPVPSD